MIDDNIGSPLINMESQRKGWLPDFTNNRFYLGELVFENGVIKSVVKLPVTETPLPDPSLNLPMILPGLVDAHVHIESSLMVPSRFAYQAVRFGTVATVSDPHEIANVLGMDGIRFVIGDAQKTPVKIRFTAPSCVPATSMESSGANLGAAQLEPLLKNGEVVALGEMMNYPGVINRDPEVMKKIEMARKYGLPVDGHAPGLVGKDLDSYVSAGISTDHESITLAEAVEKIEKGMLILIREGSASGNLDILAPLINRFPEKVMLCTDDLYPDNLLKHHIDELVRRGLVLGVGFFNMIRAASLNPVMHYNLDVGILRPGDPADFIVVNNPEEFTIMETVIDGSTVFDGTRVKISLPEVKPVNRFNALPVAAPALRVSGPGGNFRIIRAEKAELITGSEVHFIRETEGEIKADPDRDILKIIVLSRYFPSSPVIGWIRGLGLESGAMASSVAHDNHNIIAAGVDDEDIAAAINMLITHKGGIAFHHRQESAILPLPVAGLMSTDEAEITAERYASINRMAIKNGSGLKAPFMTLSFMALIVIPHLKMGDRGLFDVDRFQFIPIKAG